MTTYSNTFFSMSLPAHFPYMYFIIILFFLIPFSFFVLFQLLQLIKLEVYYSKTKTRHLKLCPGKEFFGLLFVLVEKKLWFDAIKLIEAGENVAQESTHQYFNALGFVYYSMKQYDLAKIYYTEALSAKKDYVVALQNLAKLYEVLQNRSHVLLIYQSILKYDPGNQIARQYFDVQKTK